MVTSAGLHVRHDVGWAELHVSLWAFPSVAWSIGRTGDSLLKRRNTDSAVASEARSTMNEPNGTAAGFFGRRPAYRELAPFRAPGWIIQNRTLGRLQ
jgi:hypothetical protein